MQRTVGYTCVLSSNDLVSWRWLLTSGLQEPGVIGGQASIDTWDGRISAAKIFRHDTYDDSFGDSAIIGILD